MTNPLCALNNPDLLGLSHVGGGAYLRSGNHRVSEPRAHYYRP